MNKNSPADYKRALISHSSPDDRIDLHPGGDDRVKIATPQILRHLPVRLFDREKCLEALDAAWADQHLNLYTLVALGGVGKSSLVAHWVAERFMKPGWPGVERYFDWSFYSQGTGESWQTSADLFINEALTFFGDPDPKLGSAWERGERLAKLIRRHRTLLVLDGIELLQYRPNDKAGLAGRLKDPALEALVQNLAADNQGLYIITTREHLKIVEAMPTTEEQRLDQLLEEATIAMLRHLQIVGTDEELAAAWQDAGSYAPTLQLLGRFIADAYPHDRDIRRYRQAKFAETDQERQGRSAFKVMIAYEKLLASAGPEWQLELAILRLTGLFDRPISIDCLQVLGAEPAIPGLTDALVNLDETQWNVALQRLIDIDLLSRSGLGANAAVDAHPLVREYFAQGLQRQSPEAFRAAHSRLFDHLCKRESDWPYDLEALGPLFQAVVHGCLAGRQQEACNKVYRDRILRGTDHFYSTNELGAIREGLGAVAAFFGEPWSRLSPNLSARAQEWLRSEAAFDLYALGRLTEAIEPTRVLLALAASDWEQAAFGATKLSELEVTLGRLEEAVADARRAIGFADRSGYDSWKIHSRTATANALHQAGQPAEAETLFKEGERRQAEGEPEHRRLYSLRGVWYIDLLLAPAERAVWEAIIGEDGFQHATSNSQDFGPEIPAACGDANWRSECALTVSEGQNWLLDVALDRLSQARARLYRALLSAGPKSEIANLRAEIPAALAKLRRSNHLNHLPMALLTSALYAGTLAKKPDEARRYLDEAQQIAERCLMPLYLADVHLHRARLFRDKDELAKTRELIEQYGYGRRRQELADAEAVLL